MLLIKGPLLQMFCQWRESEMSMNMDDSQLGNWLIFSALEGNREANGLWLVIMQRCVRGTAVIGSFINNS